MVYFTFVASLPLRTSPFHQLPQKTAPRPFGDYRRVQTPQASVRRPENVPGNVYVDNTCINCQTCRWVAPRTFHSNGPQAAVHKQPESEADRRRALQAMAACPTGSIRTESPDPLAREMSRSFPTPALDAAGNAVPGIYYNGYTSKYTFGASSWLLTTPDGNIMFDCPRFNQSLAKKIEAMGGIRYIVFSHQDDVHGHDVWASHFGATRVIHVDECNSNQKTDQCEMKLQEGQFPYELMPGFVILHVPGHTFGSIAGLHTETKSLFTGDHVAKLEDSDELSGFPRYNSYSWERQVDSIHKLRDVDFLHGFPGHGHPFHFENAEQRRRAIDNFVESKREVRV